MFSLRKKSRQEQAGKEAASAARIQREQQFDESIKTAGSIEDPAKKLLELEQIRKDISYEISDERKDVSDATNNKVVKRFLTGTWIAMAVSGAAALGVTLATGGVAGIIIVAGGTVVGIFGSLDRALRREDSIKAKLEQTSGAANRILKMQSQQAHIAEMTNAVVDKDVKEISLSPLYGQVLALPGITGKFAVASAKQFARDAASPVEEAPKKASNKPKAGL